MIIQRVLELSMRLLCCGVWIITLRFWKSSVTSLRRICWKARDPVAHSTHLSRTCGANLLNFPFREQQHGVCLIVLQTAYMHNLVFDLWEESSHSRRSRVFFRIWKPPDLFSALLKNTVELEPHTLVWHFHAHRRAFWKIRKFCGETKNSLRVCVKP